MTARQSNGKSNGVHLSRALLVVIGFASAGLGGVATAFTWGVTLGQAQGAVMRRLESLEATSSTRYADVVDLHGLKVRVSGHSGRLARIEAEVDRLDQRIWAMGMEGCK